MRAPRRLQAYVLLSAAVIGVGLGGCRTRPLDGPPAPALPSASRPMVIRFQVGDQVEVSVWRVEELRTVQRVLPDGTITPTLLDPLRIEGLTVQEARQKLAELYTEYVKEPKVSVRLMEIYAQRIFVLGEVRTPTAFGVLGPTSIFHAITAAGGFNEETADKYVIRIVRPRKPGVPPEVYTVDAQAILGGRRSDVLLAAGDIVYVHPTNLADWSRQLQQAFAPLGTVLGATSTILALQTLRR